MNVPVYAAGGQEAARRGFVTRTYGWMFLALLISSLTAFVTASAALFPEPNALTAASYVLLAAIFGHPVVLIGLCVTEVALVMVLGATLRRLPVRAAAACLVGYSVLNGLTLSSIFIIYSISSICSTFLAAALMFGGMSLYGATTRRNLATAGHYLMMALLGVAIVSLVNMIVSAITGTRLGMIDWTLSLVAVLIFTGLAAYDAQKIALTAAHDDGSAAYQKLAIYGALELYLDFINIFLHLLRLFGRRRD